MSENHYVKTILSLFTSKAKKDILKLATENDNIIDTASIFRTCYEYNLLVGSLSYIISGTKYRDNYQISNNNVDSVSESDIIVADEAKRFIDKLDSFGKVIKHKTTKNELFTCYMGYLFLTEVDCTAHTIIQTCTTEADRGRVIESLRNALSSAYELPNNPIFAKYGRFLTNPITTELSLCVGRDKEISAIVDIMARKKKNNPVLVGAPGVGKTAIVEGFAKLLMSDSCPRFLTGYHIYEVDLPQMLAGCKYRGDYEERIENMIKAVVESSTPIILFIDEIHCLMVDSADKTTSMAASDILKPYLTRSGIRIIGATTEKEYKMIEKDSALSRRFNKVMVKEPTVETVKYIINNIKSEYENHFNIQIPNTVIDTLIYYADNYIPNKYMPDKVFDLLDESCVHCANHTKSDTLSDSDIVSATEAISGIKVPTAKESVKDKIQNIMNNLSVNIIGQDNALNTIHDTLKRYFLGLTNPNKPIASFLFVGPTGVGKTQLCKEFASNIFNRESFIRFDMSEYMEQHSVSKLFGSPPGYVGYGEGGLLTEAVKNNPFSVILFDEIEKAHGDVYNALLQILDDGVMTDGEGTKVYFNNCIIIMTSNVGTRDVEDNNKPSIGFGNSEISNSEITRIYKQAVKKHFRPEFINRLSDVIYFNALNKDDIKNIIKLEIAKLKERYNRLNIKLSISDGVITYLNDVCYEPAYGARFVQRTISNKLESIIIDYMITNDIVSCDNVIKFNISCRKDIIVCKLAETVTI